MIRHYLILLVFSFSALSGCSLLTKSYQNPDMIQAESFIQNGQNKEAAMLYQQLADVPSSQQDYYRLLAADALIRANNIKQARLNLSMINVNALDEAQLNHLNLLQAQIDLSQGNAETALVQLKGLQVESFNNQTKLAYYQSLAFAYSLTGDVLQSAQALIDASPLIASSKLRAQHYEKILSTLDALPEQTLHLKQPLDNNTLNGWMSLARIFKLGDANLNDNLTKWRKAYPLHPANSTFLVNYVKDYQRSFTQPSVIAVFLPESGPYSAPAAVIKKGFMTAYTLAKKTTATQSEIKFYDSEKTTVASLYKQAVKDGAKLVVGPLDKKDIKALVNTAELSIPVLALNHVEGLSHPKLYQFALSPIDDAGQVTAKAHQEGHKNALFLVPKTEQGKRFASYLTDNWQSVGGTAVKVQSYDDSKTDFSGLAQNLMAENEADAIIINAYAKPARLLYQQLHKNKTTADLPVYATSQIYLGDADAARDSGLDGITFCDIPWLFTQADEGELNKFALHNNWQSLSPSYLRLLPMGLDAYNVIEHLSQLKNQPYNGATGKLTLDKNNRVTRELQCAKFVDGVAKTGDLTTEKTTPNTSHVEKQTTPAPISPEKSSPPLPELPDLNNQPNSPAKPGNVSVQ